MNTNPARASQPGKTGSALRLVKTNDLSRDEWLDGRKGGIGSSDAAASVGLNPYCSRLELFLIKTGQDEGLEKIDPSDDTSPMFWGTMLEPMVAAAYTKRTGNKVRRINAVEKTKGGIIIPDSAQEKPSEGEVIAVGPGGRDEAGKLIPIDIKTGDRVLFGKWSGTEVKLDGEDLIIMKESDVMGVIA